VSGMFENEGPADRGTAATRPPRSRALLITIGVLVGLFLAVTLFASFWTERLWFASLGYESVFTKQIYTRIGLFLACMAVMALVVGINIALAYRFRPIFRPASPEQVSLDRYRDAITPIRIWLTVAVSLGIGIFAGSSGAGKWRAFLLWRNGTDFGETDPYFDRDLGFYVFDLPWLHYVVDFAMAVVVVSLIAAALVHYLYGGIRLQSQHDRLSPAAAGQLSALLGVFVLLKAADYWLDRYDLLSEAGGLITGITYTDDHAVLPAKNILMYISLICAVLFFANVLRRTWMLPSVGLGLLALSAVLLGMIWPGIVQQFQVNPTEADKEQEYIQRNIHATRAAYDLEGAELQTFASERPAAPGEVDGDQEAAQRNRRLATAVLTHPGIRLVDPRLVKQVFEQKQQVRGYYTVPEYLDVDRYEIDGKTRDIVLGVRELDQEGIPQDSQNWANLHTVYTHGYGVIAAYGNQKPSGREGAAQVRSDEPAWAERDIPPKGDLTDLSEGGYENRIYFAENSPEYSVVGQDPDAPERDIELDYPQGDEEAGNDRTTTYDGEAGVGIGSFFRKAMYAWKFGEPNLVLSQRVHENSRILYDRDPRQMVQKVAPWLTVDADPFPAVVDGRVVWIVDGYTTTDRYPLSQRASYDDMTTDALQEQTQFRALPTDEINYMRDAVKATVDAYDGTVTLYAWDESDPMLQTWRKSFPDTVKDRSEIPEGVLAHMRYPEELFKAQRYMYARYHVEEADDFYKGSDAWELPSDPNAPNRLQPPYRLSVAAPGQEDEVFSLTSVFEPVDRDTLAAFMSVDGDAAAEEGYGQLRVARLSSSTAIPGPSQIANKIQTDDSVKERLLPFTNNAAATARFGNLLTLPVEGSLLYVQPIYIERTTGEGNYPVLRLVAVSFGDAVGVGETLEEAVESLLGVDSGNNAPSAPPGKPGEPGEPTPLPTEMLEILQQAEREFDLAEEALADGDLAAYQRHQRRAQELVDQALEVSRQAPEAPAQDERAEAPAEEETRPAQQSG
jgi:uncharacterized membrane protein (UPF0182 family)